MHSLDLDSRELMNKLEEIMQQPYVEKYINKPLMDEDKVRFLTEIYQRIELKEQDKDTADADNYACPVGIGYT